MCKRLHVLGNVFALPSEVEDAPDAGVRATVAHGDEDVVFLEFNRRLVDFFVVDGDFVFGVFADFAVANEDDVWVIELDELGDGVVDDMDNRKGRIGQSSDFADR